MMLNESMKSSNILQHGNENATNTIGGVITASTANSAGVASLNPAAGTPARSRNYNRDRQQSDDKPETTNIKGKNPPKPKEEFYKDVQQFHEKRSTPIMHMPKITGREVDLHRLYCEVTERGGFQKVNMRDEWEEILPELGLSEKIVNGSAALKYIYRRVLEKYERLNHFGEDPDKVDASELAEISDFNRGRGSRYPSSYATSNSAIIHNVALSYNYRQHVVNMDRRRQFKLSTDLHKHSPYEKLMLSMLSPLPNEQDFAINACTLMANESKHTLKLNEYPKLLDALLAHTGVFCDYTMRKMFQQIYSGVRHHSLYGFWYDLLNDKPQILELYTDEQALREAGIIDDYDDGKPEMEGIWQDCNDYDFLNLRTGLGTQDYVGQRVLQVVSILRNLSFQEENLTALVKNKTFLRFLVMSSNIRWSNVHIQALEIAGNIAAELEIQDPTIDDLTRCLMATLCDGIEGSDRGVIINCLEILYKLCQKESNEQFVLKCLNSNFYNTIALFLSLNDIMLLLFTLEAIYALTCLGSKSCHSVMQVKGIVDQLISLITVEAQTYGPDGCILMRVVETVPSNMLPTLAQNIANLQNVANIQKQAAATAATTTIASHNQIKPQILTPNPMTSSEINESSTENGTQAQLHQNLNSNKIQNQQQPPPAQMSQNFSPEDEQHALAWLGATFERTKNAESHIETQELYRMYLSHCQKTGKHSVVNHGHFPKLVRLIFTSAVGPVSIRKSDGTDLQGYHYISIRLRAQPLPLQKTFLSVAGAGQNSPTVNKQAETPSSTRKNKKKLKQAMEAALTAQSSSTPASAPTPVTAPAPVPAPAADSTPAARSAPAIVPAPVPVVASPSPPPQALVNTALNVDNTVSSTNPESVKMDTTSPPPPNENKNAPSPPVHLNEQTIIVNTPEIDNKLEEKMDIEMKMDPEVKMDMEVKMEPETGLENQSALIAQHPLETEPVKFVETTANTTAPLVMQSTNPSTSFIKSLLANKVNQRQQKQPPNPSTGTSAEAAAAAPIKVTSTAITALVNNPLMQHTPVKVGQTTIKPLNPHSAAPILEKKTQICESTPPPLAPLSGSNVVKDASGRPIILANQMLVDILDKKMVDPPLPTVQKRKIEEQTVNSKRMALEPAIKEEVQVTPSKNAANLYAEMAASILEDEDLEEFSIQPQQQQQQQPTLLEQPQQQQQPQITQTSLILPAKVQTQTSAPPLQAVPRQLMFQTNQPQLKITQPLATGNPSQIPNAVATIKTDQGLQTVPVILQQKAMDMQQSNQNQLIQHMIQPAPQQQQTYVLATNQQGQTYLVAQPAQSQPPPPPPQPTQTVLVTQTPQQQSTGQKTIIILQQQALPGQQQQIITTGPPGQGQKMIMTTSQGQQVLVTQRPQTPQQIFINPQTGTATHIQHVPVQTQTRQIIQTTTAQPQPQQQQPQTQPLQAGQISPSLLNQLNQIPATIKIHQPMPQQQQQQQPTPTQQQSQPATITRMAKTVSLVQSSNTPTAPVAIPQLQQHQSIIQQHIISGPAEKQRHVLLAGGVGSGVTNPSVGMRAIEIKETVITQAPPPTQQCQLNSQTIITTQQQPTSQGAGAIGVGLSKTPPLLQQQVQQQIRAVIEQQQHPSIIQQKISSLPPVMQLPQQQTQTSSSTSTSTSSTPQQQLVKTQNQVMAQTTKHKSLLQQQQTPTIKPAKLPETSTSLIQSKNIAQSQNATQNVVPSLPTTIHTTGVGNIKKPLTLIKPAFPIGKLPGGPPPLAAVNTYPPTVSSAAGNGNSSNNMQVSTSCEANKKEEILQTTTTAPVPAAQQATTTTTTTAPATAQTPSTNKMTSNPTVQSSMTSATTNATTANVAAATTTSTTTTTTPPPPPPTQSLQQAPQQQTNQNPPVSSTVHSSQQSLPQQNQQQISPIDAQWPYICDWRNCPRKKFKSMGDLQHHVCTSHAPDHLDPSADIFCQWGVGPGLCDGLPRKRFSLMTHLIDHHLTLDSLRAAVQRRIATGMYNIAPALPPVTIVRNTELAQRANTASPVPSGSSSSGSPNATSGLSALQAIKRHTDLTNSKELMDENEGPVTKSIRLTASLILRNLVTYTSTAKRSVRRYEPHLANIALSNVESSGTISNILYEMNG